MEPWTLRITTYGFTHYYGTIYDHLGRRRQDVEHILTEGEAAILTGIDGDYTWNAGD